MDLDDLGERICVLGPSSSGKSTLAAAISRVRSLPVVHLDQYRHQPGTDWDERPDAEFERLHDAVVDGDRWVIEGNYSQWLPGRLVRATGLVLLDASTATSVLRYLRRTWSTAERAGALEGTRDRVHLEMIRFIIGPTRENRRSYRRVFDGFEGPKVFLPDRATVGSFYRRNGLALPGR